MLFPVRRQYRRFLISFDAANRTPVSASYSDSVSSLLISSEHSFSRAASEEISSLVDPATGEAIVLPPPTEEEFAAPSKKQKKKSHKAKADRVPGEPRSYTCGRVRLYFSAANDSQISVSRLTCFLSSRRQCGQPKKGHRCPALEVVESQAVGAMKEVVDGLRRQLEELSEVSCPSNSS